VRKNLLGTLIAAAGALGAVAAANRALRTNVPPPNALGGVVRSWRWREHQLFAAEAGAGSLVLLIHGIYAGSSSYEFRHVFPLLAQRHRVVAIDLLGCGFSEKPDLDYNAEMFVEQIVTAIAEFGPHAAAIVGCSLGGAFTIRAAARIPEQVGRVMVVCPTGLAGALDGPRTGAGRAVTALVRSPLAGEALFNLLASRPSLGWFLRNQGYADPASVTADIVERYWQATHQPGARFVPAHFVGGALNCSIAEDLPRVTGPLLVAWGERAHRTSPLATAHEYVERAPNAQLRTFANSALLPHEEEAPLFAARLEQFLAC